VTRRIHVRLLAYLRPVGGITRCDVLAAVVRNDPPKVAYSRDVLTVLRNVPPNPSRLIHPLIFQAQGPP